MSEQDKTLPPADANELARREFLKWAGLGLGSAFFAGGLRSLQAREDVDNPLQHYPSREWEKIYREQYAADSSFSFVSAPNGSAAVRVRALVRNGTIIRTESEYNLGSVSDLHGNKAGIGWSPRQSAQGFSFYRLLYGPHRLKFPMCRKGWLQWAEAGFPELNAELRRQYKFDSRATDEWVRVSWEQAFKYVAQGLAAIARTYSGADGKKRLLAQGYPLETVDAVLGAGTRCCQFCANNDLAGVLGQGGVQRLANTLAYLDVKLRGAKEDDVHGGRLWSQRVAAPGQVWVHGATHAAGDFSTLRSSKLLVLDGADPLQESPADSHWLTEAQERGATLVAISPQFSASASKCSYWIPIRPATHAALWLGVTRVMLDNRWFDEQFVTAFTDFPLLVRTDTLRRLRAADVFLNRAANGADFVVWDRQSNAPQPVKRTELGATFVKRGLNVALDGTWTLKTVDGKNIEVKTAWTLYAQHLKDYDLDSVHEITGAPKDLVLRLARELGMIKPAAILQGDGVNGWFHATEMNRAAWLPLLLTGNVGQVGAGYHALEHGRAASVFSGSPTAGAGLQAWTAEDPFHINTDPAADGKDIRTRECFSAEERGGTPTKALIFSSSDPINHAPQTYELLKNVHPLIEMVVGIDVQMTASVAYADLVLPANSWAELKGVELAASATHPFLQLWKGGVPPLYESLDEVVILAGVARALSEEIGDARCAEYWKFVLEDQRATYLQRLLDASATTRGYRCQGILDGKYGVPGMALLISKTCPRVAFWPQIHDSAPFGTDTGRLNAYADDPAAISCGENFVVHREGPEATPYLPNVIVSQNLCVRPEDRGIGTTAEDRDQRALRHLKRSWAEVKATANPLWQGGRQFYLLLPRSRHVLEFLGPNIDWHQILESNFGDPYRADARAPGVGEQQLQMHPAAARDLGLREGDYVFVDADPVAAELGPVARCLVRLKLNPACPRNALVGHYGAWMATEKSARAQQRRPDGMALTADGYQANFRGGSYQALTHLWRGPNGQTAALNETLVKITKAEDARPGVLVPPLPASTRSTPGDETELMKKYLAGGFIAE